MIMIVRILALAAALVLATPARAGELKLVTRPDLAPAVAALTPQMADVTAATLVVDTSTSGDSRRLAEPFDVVIGDWPMIGTLIDRGQIAPGGIVCVGWTSLGAAVRAGSPTP